MDQRPTTSCLCKEHSGIVERLNNVEGTNESQWKEINSMKNRSMITLTAVVMTLLGVCINLIVLLVR